MTVVFEKFYSVPLYLPLHGEKISLLDHKIWPYLPIAVKGRRVDLCTEKSSSYGCSENNDFLGVLEYGRKSIQPTGHEETHMTTTRTQGSEKLLVSVNEACEILSIGRSTFYKEVSQGKIATVKIGTATRVPTTSLAQYCDCKIVEAQLLLNRTLKGWS